MLRAILVIPVAAVVAFQFSAELDADGFFQGYADRSSYNNGETASFYMSSREGGPEPAWYSVWDTAGRRADRLLDEVWYQQPTTAEPWKDGMGYEKTFDYTIPDDLKSGVYRMLKVVFVVKDPDKTSDIVILHPTNTTNAYTRSGGKGLYNPAKAETVSFHRPQREYSKSYRFDTMMSNSDFDYRYLADQDMEDYSQLENSKLLILTGVSEYWTQQARENFDRFVDEGGNVLVLAGNTMHRPVEYDSSTNPTQMTEIRPNDPAKGKWDDPELNYPVVDSISADFQWGGYGRPEVGGKGDVGWDGWKIVDNTVPYLAGTGLNVGDIIENPTGEYDGIPILGFDPETGFPIPDEESMGHHFFRLIGFDRAWSNTRGQLGSGSWFEFQSRPDSGRVIVNGSTHWTSRDEELVHRINRQMIDYMLDFSAQDAADYNMDGQLSSEDLDLLSLAIRTNATDPKFDLSADGQIDHRDRYVWIHDFADTTLGDTDLNGAFDSTDLVAVFSAGEYEDALPLNSRWQTGDWNGDGDFDTRDLVDAFVVGAYVSTAAVPEPTSRIMGLPLLVIPLIARAKRASGRSLA